MRGFLFVAKRRRLFGFHKFFHFLRPALDKLRVTVIIKEIRSGAGVKIFRLRYINPGAITKMRFNLPITQLFPFFNLSNALSSGIEET